MIPPFSQPRHRHLLILCSIAGVVAGLLVGIVLTYQWISARTGELLTVHNEQATKEARVHYLETVRNSVLSTKKEQDRLDSYFVRATTVPDFLGMIETTGRGFGLTVETISLGVSGGVLTAEIKADGTFSNVLTFTDFLEKLPYKVTIPHANFGAPETGGTWTGSFTIAVASFE